MISTRILLTVTFISSIASISFGSHREKLNSAAEGDAVETRVNTFKLKHKTAETEDLWLLTEDIMLLKDYERSVNLALTLSTCIKDYQDPLYYKFILNFVRFYAVLYSHGHITKSDSALKILDICRERAASFADNFNVEEPITPAKELPLDLTLAAASLQESEEEEMVVEVTQEGHDPQSPPTRRISIGHPLVTSLDKHLKYLEALLSKQPNKITGSRRGTIKAPSGGKDEEMQPRAAELEKELKGELEDAKAQLERDQKGFEQQKALFETTSQKEAEKLKREAEALARGREKLEREKAILKAEKGIFGKEKNVLKNTQKNSGSPITLTRNQNQSQSDPLKAPKVSWAKKITAASLVVTVIGLAALELLGSNPSKKLQRGSNYFSSLIHKSQS